MLEKIIPISGDISVDDLDLSKCDKDTLVNQVSIIFHIAATLNMDTEFKKAVNMNTEGTLRMLKLALEMKNLKVSYFHIMLICTLKVKLSKQIKFN